MGPAERRRVRIRGLLFATGGLLLALAVGLCLMLLGVGSLTVAQWGIELGVTLAAQGLLILVVYRGWEERLSWDRHFLYVPMSVAALLLSVYLYHLPEARMALLMAWFPALLFMAGLVGFVGVFGLGLVMATGYVVAIGLLIAQGRAFSPVLEGAAAVMFVAVNTYAGIVFERLRRQRSEMKALRAELATLAVTDPLTGLYNRRHFEEILRAEVSRVARAGGRCSLVMIDLDAFKHYNDSLGHVAGDAVLREIAAVMQRHCRRGDVLARYGGEEFALIMADVPKTEAVAAMERLRDAIATHPFPHRHVQPLGQMTASMGVAECPGDAATYEELIEAADAALYAAKRSGRNCVIAAAS